MNNRKCYISLYLSQQERVLFYSKSLDVLNKPIKAQKINPWHCVNKKLALWSTPTMVVTIFEPSCLTSSLLSYQLLYSYKMARTPIISRPCYWPTSEELLGKQTQSDLFKMLPLPVPCRNKLRGRGRLLLLSSMAVNDLLPGLDITWLLVLVNSLSQKAEVKPSFRDALYLQILCYYLNLLHSLSLFVS